MFVFFHVGDDVSWPTRLVGSIRAHNPRAEIVHVTDAATPIVPAVTWTQILEVDRSRLMLSRLQAFAEVQTDEPALFLDTDMIVNRPIDIQRALGNHHAAFCRRTFNRNFSFNPRQRGLDFSEYTGKTLDDVYPFVACATIATQDVWQQLLELLEALPDKFWSWYGDQEVMREYAKYHKVGHLAESDYGCLPEFAPGRHPHITHYKGKRKHLIGNAPA